MRAAMRAGLALASAALASALRAGTVEVCVRGATELPAMGGSLLRNPDPDPFVVVTLDGVSDPADECSRVGLLKGEPMRRTARDGSGASRAPVSPAAAVSAPITPPLLGPAFRLLPFDQGAQHPRADLAEVLLLLP
jgi:hypothetical protein